LISLYYLIVSNLNEKKSISGICVRVRG